MLSGWIEMGVWNVVMMGSCNVLVERFQRKNLPRVVNSSLQVMHGGGDARMLGYGRACPLHGGSCHFHTDSCK